LSATKGYAAIEGTLKGRFPKKLPRLPKKQKLGEKAGALLSTRILHRKK